MPRQVIGTNNKMNGAGLENPPLAWCPFGVHDDIKTAKFSRF